MAIAAPVALETVARVIQRTDLELKLRTRLRRVAPSRLLAADLELISMNGSRENLAGAVAPCTVHAKLFVEIL